MLLYEFIDPNLIFFLNSILWNNFQNSIVFHRSFMKTPIHTLFTNKYNHSSKQFSSFISLN